MFFLSEGYLCSRKGEERGGNSKKWCKDERMANKKDH